MNDQSSHPSEVFGATLLVAGSCIGAGMLALPVVTGLAGFLPALVVFVVGWLFMTTTGLLLLEVNLWLGEKVSIVSMAGRTLGIVGKVAAWVLFCFLFYLILTAYTAGCGALVSDFLQAYLGIAFPRFASSLCSVVLMGLLVYAGTRPVDLVNRLLMLGLGLTYVLLLVLGASHVKVQLLGHVAWDYAVVAAPIIVIAFGYHNMIPSLTRYLRRNHEKLQLAIVIGSAIPLLVYLLWEWLILGIIPASGPGSFEESLERGDLVTRALQDVIGLGWVTNVAQWFAFFAIVTSFLAQALSLVHFLADGMRLSLSRKNRAWLTALVILPPYVAALINPNIFIRALEMAGAYSAVVLFGVLPALMAWIGRYRLREIRHRLVPGGRAVLLLVMLFAVAVIVVQILHQSEVL